MGGATDVIPKSAPMTQPLKVDYTTTCEKWATIYKKTDCPTSSSLFQMRLKM